MRRTTTLREKKVRLTGSELISFRKAQQAINSEFNAELVTEFSFNTVGVLEKVCSLDGYIMPAIEPMIKAVVVVKN